MKLKEVLEQLLEQGYRQVDSTSIGPWNTPYGGVTVVYDDQGNCLLVYTKYDRVYIFKCATSEEGSLYPIYLTDPQQVCDALKGKVN